MIQNDEQLKTTLERLAWFQQQVAELRKTEVNPVNYRAAVSGFLAEMDRVVLWRALCAWIDPAYPKASHGWPPFGV